MLIGLIIFFVVQLVFGELAVNASLAVINKVMPGKWSLSIVTIVMVPAVSSSHYSGPLLTQIAWDQSP